MNLLGRQLHLTGAGRKQLAARAQETKIPVVWEVGIPPGGGFTLGHIHLGEVAFLVGGAAQPKVGLVPTQADSTENVS